MKKLLFVTALLAMGTMAMGATPTLEQNNNTKAEVEVRAHVIDDKFSITDIYGQPLVLNFKEVMVGDTNAKASVRYKVSMKEGTKLEGATVAQFKMEILGDTTDAGAISKEVVIANTDTTITGKTTTMKVGLGLDNETKYLAENGTEFQGEIFGSIAKVADDQAVGDYVGYATLKATVESVTAK